MKTKHNKEFDCEVLEPETPLEAVETLETFLIADFGAGDWSPDFLRRHFKICKDNIKKMIKEK